MRAWVIVIVVAGWCETIVGAGCTGRIILEDGGIEDGDDAGPDGNAAGDDGLLADGDPGEPYDRPQDPDAGPDANSGDDGGGADPGPCPATLAARLRTTTISVAPDSVNSSAGGWYSPDTPPILAAGASGSRVAWQDVSGRVHITPLDASDARAGPDLLVESNELRGFATLGQGFAVLIQRGSDQMALVGFDGAGSRVFDVTIVGNNDHTSEGDKWIRREWGDNGRLISFEGKYAVYFGHTMNWGAQGEHQGDLLWFYDASGNKVGGSWDWGCSHSLDVRLGWNGSLLGPVCLSDCYPSKAIWFDHRGIELHPEPSGNCAGSSNAELGGLAPVAGGFFVSFVSAEGRASHDVALLQVSNSYQKGELRWLTDTAGVEEQSAHLAPYGPALFAAWEAGGQTLGALVDESGAFLTGPEPLGLSFNRQTDFATFSNGDVGWAYGSGSELTMYRLRRCP